MVVKLGLPHLGVTPFEHAGVIPQNRKLPTTCDPSVFFPYVVLRERKTDLVNTRVPLGHGPPPD